MSPSIKLFELAPTRSARCRWTLLEAGLSFESEGNAAEVIGSDQLKQIHPLGKLPAVMIDGRPLFESAAIATAIADLATEVRLIAPSGSWSRALHDQWVLFALTEMEPWVWSTELNSFDFFIPEDEHVPDIIPQNNMFYRRSAAVLEEALTKADYLVDNRFSVTDIIVAYTLHFGEEQNLLEGFNAVREYLHRLYQREHCPLVPPEKP